MSKYTVRTSSINNARRFSYEIDFLLTDYGVASDGWLAHAIARMARDSNLKQYFTADVRSFKNALTIVATNPDCRNLLSKPVTAVLRRDIHSLFTMMESILAEEKSSWSGAVQFRTSGLFRRYLMAISNDGVMYEFVGRPFRSRLSNFRSSRPILPQNPGEMPLDALPHSDVDELKRKISTLLDSQISALIDACIAELNFWDDVRQTLMAHSMLQFTEDELRNANSYILEGIPSGYYAKKFLCMEPKRLLGAIVHVTNITLNHDFAVVRSKGWSKTSALSRAMLEDVASLDQMKPVPHAQILQMNRHSHVCELSAAFILLMIHTAWNADTLRALQVDSIVQDGSSFLIKSFKRKTGKYTSEVVLDSASRGAVQALNLLMWNHHQLKKLKIISDINNEAWATWKRGGYPCEVEHIKNITQYILRICSRNGIAPFSLEQLRTHMLLRHKVRGRSIEDVSRIAGHTSIDVTGTYLDQFLQKILSKSINLDFQNRLARKLCGPEENMQRALYLVGDGTSCVNPRTPPFETWLVNGTCDARHCHSGEGCINSRIEVTRERIEELVCWNGYYERNWQRLYEANTDAFEKLHGPAIIMNFALLSFLKNSIHRDKVCEVIDAFGAVEDRDD